MDQPEELEERPIAFIPVEGTMAKRLDERINPLQSLIKDEMRKIKRKSIPLGLS
jgi:hypothetical protein